jgi:hypothetical protein
LRSDAAGRARATDPAHNSRTLNCRRWRHHRDARSRNYSRAALMFNGRRGSHDSGCSRSKRSRTHPQTDSQTLPRQLRRRRDNLPRGAKASHATSRCLDRRRRLNHTRAWPLQASLAAHCRQICRWRSNRRIQTLRSGLRARRGRQRYRRHRGVRWSQIRRAWPFRQLQIWRRHQFRCSLWFGGHGHCFRTVRPRGCLRLALGLGFGLRSSATALGGMKLRRRIVKRFRSPVGLSHMRLRPADPSLRQRPAREDHNKMPEQRFLKRLPRQAGGQENVMPELARRQGFYSRGRLECVHQVAEENFVRGLPLDQQVQTRFDLMGNTRFRT